MFRSILSLSKITYELWLDHPFIQKYMISERKGEVWVEGISEVGVGEEWTKFEKRGW